jgi:hypothetical protein
LIRHAVRKSATTIGTLAVAMVQPPLDALLMPPVGGTMLTTPHMTAALRAAITLAAITAGANPEHRPAIGVAAKPLPENNFPVNRHALFQAVFDNGSGSCQGKTNSRVAFVLA